MIRAVLAAAAVTVPLVLAPPAAGDALTDQAFIAVLDEAGFTYTSYTDVIAAGNAVCLLLDSGYTIPGVIRTVATEAGLDPGDAGYFVGASVAAYCDEYAYLITGQSSA